MKKTKNLSLVISALLLTSCSNLVTNNKKPIMVPTPIIIINSNKTVSPAALPSTPVTISNSDNFTGYLVSKEKNEKLSDVTVELNGQTTKTDANGKFVFNNVSNGKFTIIFTKPNQYNYVRDVEISPSLRSSEYVLSSDLIPEAINDITGGLISSSSTAIINNPISSTVTNNKPLQISGFLRDSVTKKEIVNATVKIGSVTSTTDFTGYYNLKIMPGQYTMTIQKNGYNPDSNEYNFQTNKILTSYLNPKN